MRVIINDGAINSFSVNLISRNGTRQFKWFRFGSKEAINKLLLPMLLFLNWISAQPYWNDLQSVWACMHVCVRFVCLSSSNMKMDAHALILLILLYAANTYNARYVILDGYASSPSCRSYEFANMTNTQQFDPFSSIKFSTIRIV